MNFECRHGSRLHVHVPELKGANTRLVSLHHIDSPLVDYLTFEHYIDSVTCLCNKLILSLSFFDPQYTNSRSLILRDTNVRHKLNTQFSDH